ncbi:MAG TPA: septum formation initiator [Cytophagales bacterium]|nr:septum formation initiator [Cytophagales bacterium]HAA23141.1 septum formation initiator [Cytophagales bacterium]HAP61697.1 septum formation initiator [Cytophagales bacterium]
MLDRIPKWAKSFYVLVGVSFLVWMLFFDSNDFITRYRLTRELRDLQAQRSYYQEMIEEVHQDREELMSNPSLLEKFARERYLMKKPTEDVYVLVEEEK